MIFWVPPALPTLSWNQDKKIEKSVKEIKHSKYFRSFLFLIFENYPYPCIFRLNHMYSHKERFLLGTQVHYELNIIQLIPRK